MNGGWLRSLVSHLILLSALVIWVAPLWLIVVGSTHETAQLASQGLAFWPGTQGAQNYSDVFGLEAGFTDEITTLGMVVNSLVIALGVAFGTTVLSLLAAYALIYFRLPLAGLLFWATLSTLLLPIEGRFIPSFQVASTLSLVDTHLGMILPVLAVALGTLFFRQLLLSLPEEYLEAARLDGAGPVRYFVDFIVPLSWRRGGAVFVVSFMIGWTQYLWPLMLSTGEAHYTLLRGLRLIGEASGSGMALMTLSILPPLLLVFAFQRWLFSELR